MNIYKLKMFLNDPNKKPYYKIIYEALRAWIEEEEFPGHYFSKLLYRKDVDNYLDYVGSYRGQRISKSLEKENSCIGEILGNKLLFNYFFEDIKVVKIPKMIAYSHKNVFFNNNQKETVNTKAELNSLLKKWIGDKDIFVKPVSGRQGQNCFKLKTGNENFIIEDEKFKNLMNGCYIYQELISQHSEINKVYKDAVNPLRIVTYIDDNNNLHFISSFMTFGIDKKDVSNNSSGGIFINVDLNKGELKGEAVQYLEYGGLQCAKHPESGVEFDGFKIPYFEESLEMIEKAIEYLPIKFAGWDMAITEDGPCIIEGNSYPAMASIDIGYGGLKKHPIFGEIIERY